VIGSDEVGRGCLAGPLLSCAVCFDYSSLSDPSLLRLSALDDSKKLTSSKRRELYPLIVSLAQEISIVSIPARVIDEAGVHKANIHALKRSIENIFRKGDSVLVDGFNLGDDFLPHQKVIKGDSTSAAIAAASIIAKVTRDRLMERFHDNYPLYGFNSNAGYLSRLHEAAVREHGITPLHRLSYRAKCYEDLDFVRPAYLDA
jgi:ribonuclease HII